MPLPRPFFALAPLAVLAVTACQTTYDPTVHGQEQFDRCVAEACTTLALDGTGVRDFTTLNALSHVTSLMVSHTAFDDLSDISGMAQLRELHMGSTGVNDLSGLAAFPNLTLLHMQYVEVASLAPLSGLANLRELAVGSSTMSELSFMADVPQVARLVIIASAADLDLTSLGAHRGIRTIDIRGIGERDLTGLLALPNLRQVSLTGVPSEVGPAQTQVIAQLRARGVTVDLEEVAVIVC